MKRLTSVLSILLAAALMVAAMPAARAAEVTLQASGVVVQSVAADEDPAIVLASVHEGTHATVSMSNDWTEPLGLDGTLTVFSGVTHLRPGANNSGGKYKFVLVNEAPGGLPLNYTFSYTGGPALSAKNGVTPPYADVPIAYNLYVGGSATPTGVPAGGLPGTVAAGGYVEFELEWEWAWEDDNPRDTGLGVDSAASLSDPSVLARTKYGVELKFAVEAGGNITLVWRYIDENGVTHELERWENLTPGMSLEEALNLVPGRTVPHPPAREGYIFGGYKDDDTGEWIVNPDGTPNNGYRVASGQAATATATVNAVAVWEEECKWPDWLLPGILGGTVIAGGGLLAALASVPLWLLPLALPVIAIVWLCAKYPGATKPDDTSMKPDYVMPPKTGDNWTLPLLAGMGIVLAGCVMFTTLRKRKKEAVI